MKTLLLTLLSGMLFLTAFPQGITGNWQGSLDAGGKKLRIIFHITKTEAGYQTKFDSPDQNAYGLPAGSTLLQADSLSISIDLIKGGYKGRWDGKDLVTGIFSQGPANLPMDLSRLGDLESASDPITKIKPQTPKPPFSYLSEEVSYRNEEQQIQLAGTLTKPSSGNGFPVVLLITGSGPQDRDETIGLHKPFAVMADQLTKAGIAVLRVDDRGMGKSTGDFQSATSENFASDVMAGIAYLKTRTDIDHARIGLMGHSEGGVIAPYVAARSKDVAFIIMLAGPAVGGKATMYYQGVEKLLAALSKPNRDAYGKLYTAMFALSADTAAANHSERFITQTYRNWKQQQPDSIIQNLVHGSDEQMISAYVRGFSGFKSPWWKFFLAYDPAKDLEKIRIPVLALNGEKDEQVDPKANLSLIRQILTGNHNKDFKTVEVPGVNHLFQHCKQCGSIQEYLALEETFDPATLALITGWITERVKK